MASTKSIITQDKISQLFSASKQGKIEKVRTILLDSNHFLLSIGDRKGYSALHWASANGHLPVVEALVKAGARVNLPDDQGCTPLHVASRNGNSDIVKFLLQKRADIDAHDALGFTPLHWSVVRGHLTVAKALIRSSANVDALDINGTLAIHWAARRGHRDLVELLIVDGGSRVDQKDGSGMTPETWASKREWR